MVEHLAKDEAGGDLSVVVIASWKILQEPIAFESVLLGGDRPIRLMMNSSAGMPASLKSKKAEWLQEIPSLLFFLREKYIKTMKNIYIEHIELKTIKILKDGVNV